MAKIFLIGFMASGKTTIGKLLAKKLKCPFIDTDELIVKNIGMSISQYLGTHGEAAFRHKETEILTSLSTMKDAIISTGGGMPCFNNNMDLINKIGLSCYLCTSIDVIFPRVVNDKNRLLAYQKSKSELSKLYKSRLKFYNQAQYRILGNRELDKVVLRIIEKLKMKTN